MTNDQAPMANRQDPRLVIGIWSLAILPFGLSAFFAASTVLLAAPAPPAKQQLLDRTPFDVIILNQASGGTKLEVLPLKLPQRPLVAVPKDGKFKVRLL